MRRATLTSMLLVVATCYGAAVAAQATDLLSEGKAWWAHVQFLADDKLEGRNVGTPGYEKAVDYVESQFKAIGLKPAGTAGFRQPVKYDSRKLAADQSQLVLVRDGKEDALVIGQDAALTARGELNGSKDAQMVFVGYGLSIPDAGWDDLAGIDLRGKIAVYINAFAPVKVTDNVKSHANTLDERWAAMKRAGAIGIATLPPPTPPRPTVTPQPATPGAPPPPPQPVITLSDRDVQNLSGQIFSLNVTARGAEKLFAGTGHTFAELTELAREAKPLPRFVIPGTLKAHATLTRDSFDAANIAALFEGSDPALKNEYVIMTSHLDHVGTGRAVNGDTIYNGAMDDASGIAAMLQIAKMLKASGATTRRSILFVAVSGEERGLLGSRYFTAHPTVPLNQIVADINLDMFLPLYPLKVIEVQGFAESSLGESVRVVARELGVEVQTDREPDQNRFIRSDQYSFIRAGVPALAFKFGYEFGTQDEKTRLAWVRDRYHQPSDDLNQPVDLEAAAKFNR
ncbi:MAG: M20/M25/M40 family metallo-hydrolase, partial [Acidobacteriota bacterium]